jgi:hypothetical protein
MEKLDLLGSDDESLDSDDSYDQNEIELKKRKVQGKSHCFSLEKVLRHQESS